MVKGIVSAIVNGKFLVTFPDKQNAVSAPLPAAVHVGALAVGDSVAVAFFSRDMINGVILGKIGG